MSNPTMGWTLDSLASAMQRQIDDLRSMLNERYATQTRAVDAAFVAQSTAMATALTAAERLVQTAASATEKAIGKAELASDKRFEGVNEFRAQLRDQAATFLPRQEYAAGHSALAERVDAAVDRQNERLGTVESRLDVVSTSLATERTVTTDRRLGVQLMTAIAGVVVFVLSVLVTIYLSTHK
jgi:hypothetical protein